MSTPRPHPVARAELARTKGVTKGAVTRACAPGGPLHDACLPGGRVDLHHPACQAWLAKGGKPAPSPAQKAKSCGPRRAQPAPAPATEVPSNARDPEDVNDLLDLRLRDLLGRWESIVGVSDWLDARKRVAEISRLESRNARDGQRLIAKTLVRTHVLGQIQGLHRQLLESYPTTLAARLASAVRAGESQEACAEIVRSLMGRELQTAKERAIRALKHCRAGDVVPEVDEPEAATDSGAAERRAFAESLRVQLVQLAPRLAVVADETAVAAMLDATVSAALNHTPTEEKSNDQDLPSAD